ncbi:glycosyltransferase family 2 protein [Paenibacillus sp. D9]|uniref:glycosyltransferase family 2 protein n=1 Tax=Paenibacillus sp. D9 TaxID=665792 RepID=UPI000ABD81F6|nr:glycosyltransferase family 2 protein [Paenibacillus sp. D9]
MSGRRGASRTVPAAASNAMKAVPAMPSLAANAADAPEEAPQTHAPGWQEGFDHGFEAGKAALGQRWPGTSIIIPTYNKRDYLVRCLDSIRRHTPEPYEIIVVDNASADGTAAMLETYSLLLGPGKLRFRVMDRNLGFAGAVNRGLMMARGDRLLLLNNDTLVTERWLDNLTACLERSPFAGIVGPVTNFISGSQLVKVPYRSIKGMDVWARGRNKPDSRRWKETARLTGFCMLMRRSLWEAIGYFDEGYQVGNYEDDDFCLRARLLSLRLYIAGDCFIHHFGSVTVREEARMTAITESNRLFYKAKWEDPAGVLRAPSAKDPELAKPAGEASFYPGGVAAEGADGTVWWLERGVRWKIEGGWELPSVRLGRPVLSSYRPAAATIASSIAASRWRSEKSAPSLPLDGESSTGDFPPPYAAWLNGSLAYVEEGRRRTVLNPAAAERWGLHLKPLMPEADAAAALLPAGLPVIAPPLLYQRL